MKLKLSVFIFLLAATLSPAQTNSLTALLQQGLLEEQANRNLDAAIADYQSLALQFDKDRQLAATAIFRLGECYRAQGKTNEAATQYQRILRDFSDQQTLATLSGQDLAGMGQSAAPNPPKAANQFTSEGTAEQIRELVIIKKLQPMPAYRICQLAPTLLTDATLNNLIDQFNRGEQAKSPASVLNAIGDQIHERLDVLSQTLALELSISGNPATGALTNTALTGSDTTDVNDRDQSNETPLILAALNGNQKIVSILLAHKADVNAKEDAGRTVLYLAVNGNHPQIIKQLLAAGAEPNMEDVSGRTPLSIAAEYNSSEAVKILLDAKADPNVGKLDAALLSAIHAKNAASAELLLTAGANPNVIGEVDWPSYRQDFHSVAPLWLAVKMSQFPMVQLLLKFKADPNDTRTDGQSLLFSALTDTNILEALLEAGAPVDSMSVDTPSWSPHWTPLEDAVENNNAPAVALLLKHGANPNGHGSATCLQRAVFHMDDPLIFDQLLTHKADPNIRNQDGKTPLEVIKERATGNSLSWDQKGLASQIEDLLRQHGALDNPPHWNAITVARPASNFLFPVFHKGTNDWNHFTLLEAILNVYFWAEMYYVPEANGTFSGQQVSAMLPFPDFSHVIIRRPNHDSTNETIIAVNFLNSTNGLDRSKDVPLEFGDVVEIPERDHALGDPTSGLTSDQKATLDDFAKATAQLIVRDQKTPLSFYRFGEQATLANVLKQPDAQRVLLSSSDLSRVKVTRIATKTGQPLGRIFDCSGHTQSSVNVFSGGVPSIPGAMPRFGNPIRSTFQERSRAFLEPEHSGPTDFWLQNGDVIEVPDKGSAQ